MITTSLNSLAGNIKSELIAALIEKEIWTPAQGMAYVKQSKDSPTQADGLRGIIQYLPSSLLRSALETARAIGDESDRARALQGLISQLTSTDLEPPVAKKILYDLATLNRPHFLQNIPNLAPLIIKLGGVNALREITQAIIDVCRWWK